jgi:hypothetical protein
MSSNMALVYEPKCGGGYGCGVSANEYRCAHGAQINFGDLTPYLTYNTCYETPASRRNALGLISFVFCFSPQSMRPNYGENLAAVPSSYSAAQAVKVCDEPTCLLHQYFVYTVKEP